MNNEQLLKELGPLPTMEDMGISFAEKIARLIEADPHLFVAQPCKTCDSVSVWLGRSFGCKAKREAS